MSHASNDQPTRVDPAGERESKQLSMAEAIARFVTDGASVALGTFMEQKIPFSAGHEIIRQGRTDLEIVGPVSDILFDQMIGAGVVARCRAAWIGNLVTGTAHCTRRAVVSGVPRQVEMIDHSNLTLSMGLTAAALGVPYLPARTTLGTSFGKNNPGLRTYEPPFGDTPLVAVEAIRPDVAILPIQRCDNLGNSHSWGPLGVSIEAAQAARHVILVAEEIVSEEIVRSDPNRNYFPGLNVAAVVHEPWGCHPSPVQGCYNRDHSMYVEYDAATTDASGAEDWLNRWVRSVENREEYVERLGKERRETLRVRTHALSPAVDYGY